MRKFYALACAALLGMMHLNAQDSCENPQEVTAGSYTATGDITGDPGDQLTCFGGGAGEANWYVFTPTETATLLLTSSLEQNGGWDSRVHVLTGNL